jgi:hypothetical protein
MLNAIEAATHKCYSRDAVFLSGCSKCAIPYRFRWHLHVGLTFYIRKFYYWDRTNLSEVLAPYNTLFSYDILPLNSIYSTIFIRPSIYDYRTLKTKLFICSFLFKQRTSRLVFK